MSGIGGNSEHNKSRLSDYKTGEGGAGVACFVVAIVTSRNVRQCVTTAGVRHGAIDGCCAANQHNGWESIWREKMN